MRRLNTAIVVRRYIIITIIIAMSINTVLWSLYIIKLQSSFNLKKYSNKIVSPPIVRFRAPIERSDAKILKNSIIKESKPSNSTLGFDRIYVTDVSNQPGRREKLEAIANELNLDFTFFPAVSQFDHEALNELNLGDELQPIQKSYYISHYKIYKSIVHHGYDNALILEDDIDIELNIKSIMADTHLVLPANWEILYLGHCSDLEGTSVSLPLLRSDYKLYKSKKPYCTHAYAVSSIGALKLLRKLSKPTMVPIDLELVNMIEQGILQSYTLIPPVVSRWHIYDNKLDAYPGKKTFDFFQLKNSTYQSLGFNHESNSTFGFEHIYVINLLSRPDRRERLEKLASKLNLKFEFFEAVSKYDKEIDEIGGDLSSARKACYLSHYKIYQSIVKRGYGSALILEDDVDFELNIASIIADAHRILPSDWEMFYLGYCGIEGGHDLLLENNDVSSSYKVYKSRSPVCNHGYAVSYAGALHLLEKLNIHNNPHEPIDIELLHLVENDVFKSYSLVPPVIIQWRSPDNPSDIVPANLNIGVYDFYFLKNSALHVLLGLEESKYLPYPFFDWSRRNSKNELKIGFKKKKREIINTRSHISR